MDFPPDSTEAPVEGSYIVTGDASSRHRSGYLVLSVREVKRTRREIDSRRFAMQCQRVEAAEALKYPHFALKWYLRDAG